MSAFSGINQSNSLYPDTLSMAWNFQIIHTQDEYCSNTIAKTLKFTIFKCYCRNSLKKN